jgi:hypothetical protein
MRKMKEFLIYICMFLSFMSHKTFAQESQTNDSLQIGCNNQTYSKDLVGFHNSYGEVIIIFKKFTHFAEIYATCQRQYNLNDISNLLFVPARPILLERDFNLDNLIVYDPLLNRYDIFINNIKGIEFFNSSGFLTYDSLRPNQIFAYFDLTNLDMYLNNTHPITSCSYLTLANMTTSLTQKSKVSISFVSVNVSKWITHFVAFVWRH